jgi:tRNA U34 5-carboxymethylaminomethyl modifying enzyme MnmG/GidA
MISEERYARFNEKRQQIDAEIKRLSDIRISSYPISVNLKSALS